MIFILKKCIYLIFKKIVDFVVAAITEEIKDMVAAKEGGNLPTSLNKNGKLMKLLNSVNRE